MNEKDNLKPSCEEMNSEEMSNHQSDLPEEGYDEQIFNKANEKADKIIDLIDKQKDSILDRLSELRGDSNE